MTVLFWALSLTYQGMVVKLVQDVQDDRRDNTVRNLLASVSPVFWPLLAVSILFGGIAVGIGIILLTIPGLILTGGERRRRSRYGAQRVGSLLRTPRRSRRSGANRAGADRSVICLVRAAPGTQPGSGRRKRQDLGLNPAMISARA